MLMNQTAVLRILFLCLCILAPLNAQAKSANKQTVLKLWKTTQIDVLIDNLKSSTMSGNQSLIKDLAEENKKKIQAIVEKDFETLKPHMKGYMISRGSTTLLKKALKWVNTPLGKKITEMKIIPQSLFADPEVPIPVKEPELSRDRSLIKKKFEAQFYTVFNNFTEKTQAHFIVLQNHTQPPEKRLSDKELDQKIKLAMVKVSPVTQKIIPHVFDRNYSSLSLEELTVTMNFMTSDAGKSYTDLLFDAYKYAITKTEPKALLALSKLFEDELSILSPYSKKKITQKKERELMALLVKQHGKATVIRAMIDARHGQMTIKQKGEYVEVYGRPNQNLVTLDTLLKDLGKSRKDIREFYKILQKRLR